MRNETRVAWMAVFAGVLTSSGAWACLAPSAAGGLAACSPCATDMTGATMTSGVSSFSGMSEGQAIDVMPALSGLPAGESVATVHVLNFDYSLNASGPIVDPIISAGDTVHWIFDTSFHSVTSVAGSTEVFDSGVFTNIGATFDHTFSTPGTYQYYCSIHGFDSGNGTAGGMSGFVTVLAVPEPMSALALALPLARRRR
jgi:hypothetical protein